MMRRFIEGPNNLGYNFKPCCTRKNEVQYVVFMTFRYR